MPRALVLLLLVALLLGPVDADEEGIPAHFMSGHSEVGDWSTHVATVSFADRCEASDALPKRIVVTYRVTAVERETIEVATETDPPHAEQWRARSFSKESTSLRELLSIAPDVAITELKHGRARKRIGEKTFDCTRVTFVSKEGSLVQQNTLWLSREVKSLRFVSLETRVVSGSAQPVTMTMEIAGYGRGKRASWGKKAEELK